MAVKLVFLGKLADLAGAPEREIGGPLGWKSVLDALEPELAAAVQGDRVCVALNGELVADKAGLFADGDDELAFLPPVSGG